MKVGYIKKSIILKEEKFLEKVKKKWRAFQKKIIVEEKGNCVYFIIPDVKKEKNKKKIGDKLNNLLNQYKINNLVFSKKSKEEKEIKNILYANGKNILNGKKLYKVMLNKIIDYITNQMEIQKQNVQVTFLVNENTEDNMYIIENIAKQIKRVNIVTNHIEYFRNLENKLYEEEGILLVISNNKKRSLSKAQIIVNIDFPEELVNKYEIYQKAIWIGIDNIKPIKNKRFQGIYITNYNITWQGKEKNEEFEENVFYESLLWNKTKMKEWIEELNKDKVKIKELIGRKGIIANEEYKINKKEIFE